ncbi:hypothetical protein ACIQNV_37255 [Streptomyces hydrogenans]
MLRIATSLAGAVVVTLKTELDAVDGANLQAVLTAVTETATGVEG